jgi:lysophospholipase L1-like esterase
MPNYGSNGQTIAGFIMIQELGLAVRSCCKSDLVIFCYGINDIRQNH